MSSGLSASNTSAAENYRGTLNLTDIVVASTTRVTVAFSLPAGAGTLSVPTASGRAVLTGSAGVYQLTGSSDAVNSALAALVYKPASGYYDTFSLKVSVFNGSEVVTGTKTFSWNLSASDNLLLGNGNNQFLFKPVATAQVDAQSGQDTLIFSGSGAATVNLSATADQIKVGSTAYHYKNFEHLNAVNATGNLNVTANSAGSKMTTGSGADTIKLGAGVDTIKAGNGNDTVVGAASAGDQIYLQGGNDTYTHSTLSTTTTLVDGGTGVDTLIYKGSVGKTINFSNTSDNIASETGVYANFEDLNATTATGNLNVTAGTGSTQLLTGSGNDTISAAAAEQGVTINAGSGNNTVLGSAHNDTITLGSGRDLINAGDGSDTINGTLSVNDQITLGAGEDSFTYQGALPSGAAVDGGADNDTLTLADDTAVSTVDFRPTSGDDRAVFIDEDPTSYVNFESLDASEIDTDLIVYAGADTGGASIQTGSGDDFITLGDSADTVIGGLGDDTVSTGELTSLSGAVDLGNDDDATDTLQIEAVVDGDDETVSVDISEADLQGIEQIVIADNAMATVTIDQNALIVGDGSDGTQTVTLSEAGEITGNAFVENYLLANEEGNLFTLGAVSQNVTGAADHATTVSTGSLNSFEGELTLGDSDSDTLQIEAVLDGDDNTVSVNISDAALTGVEHIALAAGAAATMTIAQNTLIAGEDSDGTQTVTLSEAGTVTGNAFIEEYVLANAAGNTFTLGASSQNVSGAASHGDTVSTGTLTYLDGALALGSGGNDILSVEHVDAEGDTLTVDISDLSDSQIEEIALAAQASVKMTVSQHAKLVVADGTDTTVTLSNAGTLTGNSDVENYVLANAAGNDFTLGANSQNVTGGTGNDIVRLGSGTLSASIDLGEGDDTLVVGVSADITGADLSGIENLELGRNVEITLSADQLAAFSSINGDADGPAAVTVVDDTGVDLDIAELNLSNVDSLTLTSHSDTLTVGLTALQEFTEIDGSAGVDTLALGEDVTGIAAIDLSSATNVITTPGYATVENFENLDAASYEGDLTVVLNDLTTSVTTGSGDDTVTYNAAATDAVVHAGEGLDKLVVGAATTQPLFQANFGTGGDQVGSAGEYFGFENLDATNYTGSVSFSAATGTTEVLTGSGNDNIDVSLAEQGVSIDAGDGTNIVVGSGYDDDITLGSGNDTIYAGAGADTVHGTLDAGDSVDLGADDDTFTYQTLAGTVDGGEGMDTLTVASTTGAMTINFSTNNDNIDEIGFYKNFENLSAADATHDLTVTTLASTGGATIITGSGNDTITLNDAADSVTGGDGDDTVHTGTLASLTGTLALGSDGGTTDTLIVDDDADISDATTDEVEEIELANDVRVTMTIDQSDKITVAAGTDEIVTLSDAGEVTGNANVESYVLADDSGNIFTLGAIAQNVTGTDDQDDVVKTGALTSVTGDLLLGTGDGTDTLVVEIGANISAADTSEIEEIELADDISVTMTIAQSNKITLAEGNETVILSDAGVVTGHADVETYELADDTGNVFTLGDSAQNVTGSATQNDVVKTGTLDSVSGQLLLGADGTDKLVIEDDANISGADTSEIEEIELADDIAVTMTIAQNAKITVAGGDETVTISDTGSFNADAAVETYILANGINSITLTDSGQSVTGGTGADTVDLGSLGTLTGDIGLAGGADVLSIHNMTSDISGATLSGIETLDLDEDVALTLNADQLADFSTVTGVDANEAVLAIADEDAVNLNIHGIAFTDIASLTLVADKNDALTVGADALASITMIDAGASDGDLLVLDASGGDAVTGVTAVDLSAANNQLTSVSSNVKGFENLDASGYDTGLTVTGTTTTTLVKTGDGDDTLNLGTATGAITVDAGNGTNSVTTGSGADEITLGAGADTVNAGDDADTIIGTLSSGDAINLEAGNDSFTLQLVNGATVDAGADLDTLVIDALGTGPQINVTLDTALNDQVSGNGIYQNFENLDATNSSRSLSVVAGADTTSIVTGIKTDFIDASAASAGVTIDANAGDDQITGSSYADHIFGGTGADIMAGGSGTDVFDFSDLGNNDGSSDFSLIDEIIDFDNASETLNFSSNFSDAHNAGNYLESLADAGSLASLKVAALQAFDDGAQFYFGIVGDDGYVIADDANDGWGTVIKLTGVQDFDANLITVESMA